MGFEPAAWRPVTYAFSWLSPLAPCEPGPCRSQSPAMNTPAAFVLVNGMDGDDPAHTSN